jgi:hypothetical protein
VKKKAKSFYYFSPIHPLEVFSFHSLLASFKMEMDAQRTILIKNLLTSRKKGMTKFSNPQHTYHPLLSHPLKELF